MQPARSIAAWALGIAPVSFALLAACGGPATRATTAERAPTSTSIVMNADSPTPAVVAPGPPAAPVRPVTDMYFGTAVVDPYRWMEDPGSTELSAWMKAQNDFTRGALGALPQRPALLARITALDHTGLRVSGAEEWGGRWFYYERAEGHGLARYCVRDGLAGSERVLVDPEASAVEAPHAANGGDGAGHYAIDWAVPSRDGKLVAYALSQGGSERSVLHVVDATTGQPLADAIDRLDLGGVSWLDAKHFFYTRLQKLPEGAPQTEKNKRAIAYLHELGRDPANDPAILGAGVTDAVPMADTEVPLLEAPEGSRWVFAIPRAGVRHESSLYYAPRARLAGGATPWKKLVDARDDVTGFAVHGDDVYLLTHHGAPRYAIVKTSLLAPDVAHASVVVPESDAVIRWLGVARDALYVSVLDAGLGRVRRVPFAGASREDLALPAEGTVRSTFTRADRDGLVFALEGWTVSPRIYTFDPKTKSVTDARLLPPSPVDFSGIVSEEVRATSADGTKVPLSILHPKDLARNGAHPTRLAVYGAYGTTTSPFFSPTQLAWLEHDAVYAICHARGGGELGDAWHRDGMLLKKQHTVDDMIACAKWLIDEKYTSPAWLAGEGTSAGGIAIGGALTQRPDLFAAAIVRVGISNPLRFEHTRNVLNVPELGSATTEDGFKGLLAMDPYCHVKDGERYPAVLLTTGAADPLVAPWQVTKMAARLQAATSSGNPILLRVDYEAGHVTGATASQRDEQLADEDAFLLSRLGK